MSLLGGGFGDTVGGWGDVLSRGLDLGLSYSLGKKALKQQRRALRTFAPTASGFAPSAVTVPTGGGIPAASGGTMLGGVLGGILGGLLPEGVTDVLPGGLEESGTGLFGLDLFRPTAASARQRMLDAPHPTTGERVYWRPVGRPVLFSGDLQLLRRTNKTIRRFCGPAGVARGAGRFRRRR